MSLLDVLMQSPMPVVYLVVPFFAFILPVIMGKDWPIHAPPLFRDEGCDETREREGWERQRVIMLAYSFAFYLVIILLLIARGP